MVLQTKNFENVSVNIYETGFFTKFDERDPGTNFFDDITKSNYDTLYFKPNEVKPYLRSTLLLMSCMSIFEVLNVILKS